MAQAIELEDRKQEDQESLQLAQMLQMQEEEEEKARVERMVKEDEERAQRANLARLADTGYLRREITLMERFGLSNADSRLTPNWVREETLCQPINAQIDAISAEIRQTTFENYQPNNQAAQNQNGPLATLTVEQSKKLEEHCDGYLDFNGKVFHFRFNPEALKTCTLTEYNYETQVRGQSSQFIRTIQGLPLLHQKQTSYELKFEGSFQPYDAMVIGQINDELQSQIKGAIAQVKQNNVDYAAPVANIDSHFLVVKANDSDNAFILDYRDVGHVRSLKVASSETKITTFNPYSSITCQLQAENQLKHRQTVLANDTIEYQFVAKLFTDTHGGQPNIHSILKLENKTVQANFINELKKNFDKFQDKMPSQLIKLMFHGSRGAQANAIYESEDGLDIRFSNGGAAGQGIYFADNSQYSIGYCSSENIDG